MPIFSFTLGYFQLLCGEPPSLSLYFYVIKKMQILRFILGPWEAFSNSHAPPTHLVNATEKCIYIFLQWGSSDPLPLATHKQEQYVCE